MDSNKVVWSEGMFLSPQHFQQQERYTENFTREFVNQIAPNSFGLSALELDLSLPKVGKILVKKAKGIFPDGTPFELKEGLVIDIPESTFNKRVYLALPVTRSGALDVGDDIRLRNLSVEHHVYDTNRKNGESILLELAELNVVLKLEGDELQDYTLLPIVLISERKPEGEVILNQAFIPNCLHFGVSSYLVDTISEIYISMQYRAQTIFERLQSDRSSKSYQSLIRDTLWLQVLGYWLPRFKQWNEEPTLLTKQLYTECISMTGQIQGLEGKMPREFASWNQNNLYGIFSTVLSDLSVLLREIQIDNVTLLKWDTQLFAKRRLLRALVEDRSLFNESRFILVATSKIGSLRLSEEFVSTVKLAGNSDIAALVRNGLFGVPLRNLPNAPSELKSKNDAAYFEVDTQSDLWQSFVAKNEAIALHIDERIEDIHVEFYSIR